MGEYSIDQDIAEQVGAGMYARDRAAQTLGIDLVAIGPGRATMRLAVGEDMLNLHGACHGGFIFSLADTCFGYACNSYNQMSVGRQCEISYIKPAGVGDVLTGDAREVHRNRRNTIYDVTVTNHDGEVVALLRGHARILEGEVVPNVTVAT